MVLIAFFFLLPYPLSHPYIPLDEMSREFACRIIFDQAQFFLYFTKSRQWPHRPLDQNITRGRNFLFNKINFDISALCLEPFIPGS